jgi:hypothetical protein
VIRFTLAAVLMLALAGCASVPMADRQADQQGKRFDPPAQGMAAVYVYRPGWMALAKTVEVSVAGGPQAVLASNTYFRMDVRPGAIDVVCKTDNTAERQIVLAAGETRYVEVAMNGGVLGPRCSVNEVSAGAGQAGVLRGKRVMAR